MAHASRKSTLNSSCELLSSKNTRKQKFSTKPKRLEKGLKFPNPSDGTKLIPKDIYDSYQVVKSVGCYTILNKLLGNSPFSIVYYGVNEILKKPVAIKIMKNNSMTTSSVENELVLLNKLKSSKRIIQMEHHFSDLYNFYMIFELADFNLMDYYDLNQKIFNEESMVLKFFRKIVFAVKELHDYGVAHRDIKLENILIFSKVGKKSESIRIKLADLGLSKNCDKNKKFNDYCGSPIYSAPEVNMGISYVGFKYDVWTLGIILYFLCFGDFPFNVFKEEVCEDNEEPEDIIKKKIIEKLYYKIQNDELCFNHEKNFSEELKSMIISLLKKDPEERPYIEELFSHPWLASHKNYH
jgi:serine/threonine protein kinase